MDKNIKNSNQSNSNKNKGIAPPRYDEAFKAGAIRLVTEQQRPAKDVAAELGLCIDTLRSWLKNAGALPQTIKAQNKDAQRLRELETENRALRKALTEKTEAVEILKKSVGIILKP